MRKRILPRCGAFLAGICLLLTACGGQGADSKTSSAVSTGEHTSRITTAGSSAHTGGSGSAALSSIPENSSGIHTTGDVSPTKSPSRATAAGNKTTASKAQGSTGSGGAAKSLLNAATLNPIRTNCAALDKKLDEIFAQILKAGMSTYDKVKACFDYLVKNGVYTQNLLVEDPTKGILYDSALDANIVALAYGILTTNRGVCDHYSAAFMVMTRAIGLESYFVGGQVRSKGGGYTGHAWVNIRLNGTYYVFDPQVQQNNTGAPYYYFCKTDAQMGSMYKYENRETMVSEFHNFRYYPEISATLTVHSDGKTYQASLSQSSSANGSGVFPEGIPVGSDGSVSIDITPAGGTGNYLCQIGYYWNPGYYVEEAITGAKSYTIQVESRTAPVQVAIQGNDPDYPLQGAVIFEFMVNFKQD